MPRGAVEEIVGQRIVAEGRRERQGRRGERTRWEGQEARRLDRIRTRGPDPGGNAPLACHNGNRPFFRLL